jgi:cupin superfamily acireductone dioxygenase involved in methionine salvage
MKVPRIKIDQVASWFEEHKVSNDVIRFFEDGEGYFDVRDKQDRWIRILVERSDFIIFPAGIWHRYMMTEKVSNCRNSPKIIRPYSQVRLFGALRKKRLPLRS